MAAIEPNNVDTDFEDTPPTVPQEPEESTTAPPSKRVRVEESIEKTVTRIDKYPFYTVIEYKNHAFEAVPLMDQRIGISIVLNEVCDALAAATGDEFPRLPPFDLEGCFLALTLQFGYRNAEDLREIRDAIMKQKDEYKRGTVDQGWSPFFLVNKYRGAQCYEVDRHTETTLRMKILHTAHGIIAEDFTFIPPICSELLPAFFALYILQDHRGCICDPVEGYFGALNDTFTLLINHLEARSAISPSSP